MDLNAKKITVAGAGITGMAVARFLAGRGARVTLSDSSPTNRISSEARQLAQHGVALELGGHQTATFTRADLVVISPGVPHTIEPVRAARNDQVPVIGEIELAARFIKTPIIAVTGTNGKTTTTELIGRMLRVATIKAFVGGNIGRPLIEQAETPEAVDWIVAEISSFQLDTIDTFRPQVAVLLNITDDHLDRYDDLAAYTASKARVFENQTDTDIAILNGHDALVRQAARQAGCRKRWFNAGPGQPGARVLADKIAVHQPGTPDSAFDLTRTRLTGTHNHENAAAACLAALAAGAAPGAIQKALDNFEPLPHRVEYVATIDEVAFYNDSKATNVGAVRRAVASFDAPVILIMGGRDKEGRFAALTDVVQARVKRIIVLGEAQDAILDALQDACNGNTERAGDLPDAVARARMAAAPGDVVLLSPACASFDMFNSYGHRGDVFRQAVKAARAARRAPRENRCPL